MKNTMTTDEIWKRMSDFGIAKKQWLSKDFVMKCVDDFDKGLIDWCKLRQKLEEGK